MAEPDIATAPVVPAAVEDNSPAVTPPAEPTTSSETAPEAPAPVAAEPERPPRAERRIQQLSAQLREATERPSYVPQSLPTPQAPKLSEMFAGQDSIEPDQLDKYGAQLYQQGAQSGSGLSSLEVQALRNEIQQKEAINNYSRDETLLATRFTELNPDSDDYIPLADEKIAKAFQERAVRQNRDGSIWVDPSVKLADVATDYIEAVRAGEQRGKARSTSNLADLVDNGALQPNTESVQAQKSFEDMSVREMEAHLRSKGHDLGK